MTNDLDPIYKPDPTLIDYLEKTLAAAKRGEVVTYISACTILPQGQKMLEPRSFSAGGARLLRLRPADLQGVLAATMNAMGQAAVQLGQYTDDLIKRRELAEAEAVLAGMKKGGGT